MLTLTIVVETCKNDRPPCKDDNLVESCPLFDSMFWHTLTWVLVVGGVFFFAGVSDSILMYVFAALAEQRRRPTKLVAVTLNPTTTMFVQVAFCVPFCFQAYGSLLQLAEKAKTRQ